MVNNTTPAHVDQLTSTLLAQQLPLLSKFSGEPENRESVTSIFQEWLEQLELNATVCSWPHKAKLVKLITRLHGQAYVFFWSCTME